MDLQSHLCRQIAWSRATFGPGTRHAGVIDHIRKELREVEAAEESPERIKEWVDLVILSLDGLWREVSYGNAYSGITTDEIAESVVAASLRKQAKNELRDWPDWRTMPFDKAIEHVRQPRGSVFATVAAPSGPDSFA